MQIGIIGAGMVGGALANALTKVGHQITISAREPAGNNLQSILRKAGPNIQAGDNQSVADFGEIVILASPWPSTKEILKGLSGLKNKIIIDLTNPILADFSGLDKTIRSGGEAVAEWASDAIVVKTLNHISSNMMDHPSLEHGKPIIFVAGDDNAAKSIVVTLLEELEFEAEDCGALSMSTHLESLAWLYINRAMVQNKGRHFAFTIANAIDKEQ
ncbi:MAG: NAD(P)-binding domain-containing protein [Marinicaulis sp.]|nr:NAD(P)-binding domain-containing protein [Marinicaulis sp.]NNL87587.1 NAD(P)-binding domain-containing protein [Marinicaulis sp.]